MLFFIVLIAILLYILFISFQFERKMKMYKNNMEFFVLRKNFSQPFATRFIPSILCTSAHHSIYKCVQMLNCRKGLQYCICDDTRCSGLRCGVSNSAVPRHLTLTEGHVALKLSYMVLEDKSICKFPIIRISQTTHLLGKNPTFTKWKIENKISYEMKMGGKVSFFCRR